MITKRTKHGATFYSYFQKVSLLLLLSSCSNDLTDDPIYQPTFADIQINLSLPEYFVLQSTGGYKYISEGVRGIILYRKDPSTILAFERNCSYQPGNACATVEVHSSNLYMSDPCCGSTFRFEDGSPNGGPAWRPLQQYNASLNGNTVVVTDEVINY